MGGDFPAHSGSLRTTGLTRRSRLLCGHLDVRLVVDREATHEDAEALAAGRILNDCILAHPAGLELRPFLRLEIACGEHVGGVVGEVAEVDEAPQRKRRRAAVHRIREHFARQTETAYLDLVAE